MRTKYPIEIKTESHLVFFDREGISIGNTHYPHKEWLSFSFDCLRKMSGLELTIWLAHGKYFGKLYREMK